MNRLATATLMISTLAATPLLASGAGSMPQPPQAAPRAQMSPHDQAVGYYNSAERRLEQLTKLHDQMKATTDAQLAAKLQQKITKGLEAAAADLERTVKSDPKIFQAYSELGFTQRKLGRFKESLQAYDQALQIEPNFSPAIEYRAEAYLGLNRTDEAREAYTVLFAGDRARADTLLVAMKSYVSARRTDPAGLDAQQLDAFAKWVEQREVIHSQTAALTQPTSTFRSW